MTVIRFLYVMHQKIVTAVESMLRVSRILVTVIAIVILMRQNVVIVCNFETGSARVVSNPCNCRHTEWLTAETL